MSDWIKRFTGQLEVAGVLTDQQLLEVPARRGVLGLLGERDAPVVLLTAADIRARLRNRLSERPKGERKKTADLRKVTRRILWKLTSSHFESDWEFLEISARMFPKNFPDLLGPKRAWFVRVDPEDPFPHFARTREIPDAPIRQVGPFPTARSADRFIAILQDTFDLCRDVSSLRSSPNAPRCAYGQMNRCLCACDGTISMSDYRRAVIEAANFAAGNRDPFYRRLERQMKEASEELAFERAGSLKGRRDRLEELTGYDYAHVAPIEEFRYIGVQRGTARKAKVFLVNRGDIVCGGVLDYPLKEDQLQETLEQMAMHVGHPAARDPLEPWRIAMVAHYLFSAPPKRGVMMRWNPAMGTAELSGAIEVHKKHLKLRTPKPPATKNGASKPSN
ncbi:MAG: hypothetical protein ACYSTL_04985 [Planctomycetota bacterium]